MTEARSPHRTAFARRLREGPLAVALEITPPQSFLPKVLLRRAGLLDAGAQAINVIQRPGRMTSLDASIFLREQGFDPSWHLVARGRTTREVAADLDRAASAGINHVLCILGDQATPDGAASPSVRTLVQMAADQMPGAVVGATFNQYGAGQERALTNLFAKLEAGATYVQTQPVFDTTAFFQAADRIHREYPEVALVPMVMPLVELPALDRIEDRLGVAVPDGFRSAVAAGVAPAWDAFDRLLDELVGGPAVRGLAVMTFEMDAPASAGRRLLEALARAGAPMPAHHPANAAGER